LLSLLIWCSLFTLLGTLVGGVTGLVPGLHPNTIAILVTGLPQVTIVLTAQAATAELPIAEGGAILLGAFLIGVLMAHSFVEIIPTAMMGIAGDDTIVALLPAQRLYLLGRTDLIFEAVMIGGLGSLAIFAVLLFPLRAIMSDPVGAYSMIRPVMGIVLIVICAIVLLSSRDLKKLLRSLLLFGSSGMIGVLVLSLQVPSLVTKSLLSDVWSADSSSFLLAAFAGFFAIPSIAFSRMKRVEHKQSSYRSTESTHIPRLGAVFRGILPSFLVGWIPAVTNAYATSFAFAFKRDNRPPLEASFRYLVTYSATNMGGALQAILALAAIYRARNGTLEAITGIISRDELGWLELSDPPVTIIALLWSACLASVVGAALCLLLGKKILCSRRESSRWWIRPIVLVFLMLLILWSSGPIGYLVMLPCFLLGSLAIVIGAPRVHLMGFLLVPAILYFVTQ